MEKVIRWWVGAEPDHYSSGRQRLLIISLLAICAATFALGVPRLRFDDQDVFICLDGAWRILNGQRPVLDFYAAKGPAWFMLHALGLALAGNNARSLGYVSTIVAVLIGTWSFCVLRRRMAPAPCFVACISLMLLAVSPFPLGELPTSTSFAMTFNRYGFALAGLVLLECFLPSSCKEDSLPKQFGGGFSSGLACAVMLFVKISFGLVGLVLAGASVVLRPRERVRWLGLIAGFATFVLPILAYLRFDIPAIVREYRLLAMARGRTLTISSVLFRTWQERFELAPVLLLTLLVVLFAARGAGRRITLAAAGLLAAVGGMLLLMTNTQQTDLPLMAAVALLLVNEVTCAWMRSKADMGGPTPLAALTFLSFGLLVTGIPLSMDAAGLTYALADKVMHVQPAYHLQAPHLRALEFVKYTSEENGYDYGELFVRYTEEAMDLVKAHSAANESVRSMTVANLFSYALLRPPPPGGAVDINHSNFSEKSMPPLGFILGDVDLILIPKIPAADLTNTIKFILTKYHDELEIRYLIEAESPHWKLLRKRTMHGR